MVAGTEMGSYELRTFKPVFPLQASAKRQKKREPSRANKFYKLCRMETATNPRRRVAVTIAEFVVGNDSKLGISRGNLSAAYDTENATWTEVERGLAQALEEGNYSTEFAENFLKIACYLEPNDSRNLYEMLPWQLLHNSTE